MRRRMRIVVAAMAIVVGLPGVAHATGPTVTSIVRAPDVAVSKASQIAWTVNFSEDVVGLDTSTISIVTSDFPGLPNDTSITNGVSSGTATSTVNLIRSTGSSGSGSFEVRILNAGAIHAASPAGTALSGSCCDQFGDADHIFIDRDGPVPQLFPDYGTGWAPGTVRFFVQFDEAVKEDLGQMASAFAIGGTAGGTTASVAFGPDPAFHQYLVTVSGMTQAGTVTLDTVPGGVHDALDNPGVVAPGTNPIGQRTADYVPPSGGTGTPSGDPVPIGGGTAPLMPGPGPLTPVVAPVPVPPQLTLGGGTKLKLGSSHVARLPVTCTGVAGICALRARVLAGRSVLAKATGSATSGKPAALKLRFGRAAVAKVRRTGAKGLKIKVVVTATAGGTATTVTRRVTVRV